MNIIHEEDLIDLTAPMILTGGAAHIAAEKINVVPTTGHFHPDFQGYFNKL